jgi:hypothetical protein
MRSIGPVEILIILVLLGALIVAGFLILLRAIRSTRR